MPKLLSASNDTNTQAMTEVALGLSMAFFSLLILALLSISAGNDLNKLTADAEQQIAIQSQTYQALDALSEQSRLSLAQADTSKSKQDTDNSDAANNITFIFYYQGRYFDANLKIQSLLTVNPNKQTIVAVVPNLSFAEVMQVHKDFIDKNIQITAMDANWQRAFALRTDTLAIASGN